MVSFISRENRYGVRRCVHCDHRIRLLGDPQSVALFLDAKSAQRRAHQCMNCGQVICSDCGRNEFRCACGCNAWVALPYLADSIAAPAGHRFA